jgi:hypothetical protein
MKKNRFEVLVWENVTEMTIAPLLHHLLSSLLFSVSLRPSIE